MNTLEGFSFQARQSAWCFGVDLFGYRHGGQLHPTAALIKPLESVEVPELDRGRMIESAITLDQGQAQGLMDSLWSCGMRPGDKFGAANTLAATASHLRDMRAIAFSRLKMDASNV